MKYSPECVAAFEAKFPPPSYLFFCHKNGNYQIAKMAWQLASAHSHAGMVIKADETIRMLNGFAANWERVRELENLIVHASVHSAYPECGRDEMSSDERALFDEVLGRHRKLLEKGDE